MRLNLPSPLMKTVIITIVALVAGIGGGYLLGLGNGKKSGANEERVRLEGMLEEKDRLLLAEKKKIAAAEGAPEGSGSEAVPMPNRFSDFDLGDIINSPGPMDRFQAIMAYIQKLPKEQLADELAEIRSQLRGGSFDAEKMFAMHLLLTRFGAEDFDGAIEYLGGLDIFSRGMGTMAVLTSAASMDPKRAIEYFEGEGSMLLNMPRIGGFAAGNVAKEWAKQDPEAAIEWAKGLPDSARGGALEQVVGGMAIEDPQKAASVAMDLEPGRDRTGLLGDIAEKWAAENPTEAMTWANSLEGEERTRARREALGGWAETDPKAAAGFVDTLDTQVEKNAAVGVVGSRWARQNPSAAAQWVGDQPESDGKANATGSVMRVWTAAEPEQASQWLADQPAGASRDRGIIGLADTIGPSDPDSSMDWVASISNAETRTQQLNRRTKIWLGADSEGATNWINTSDRITDEERAGLLPQQDTDAN